MRQPGHDVLSAAGQPVGRPQSRVEKGRVARLRPPMLSRRAASSKQGEPPGQPLIAHLMSCST
jgi:hypothetical protein